MFDKDSSLIFERYQLISESKQNIINLHYPKLIVDLLYEKFGRNSFVIAKWLKEYMSYRVYKDTPSNEWFDWAFREMYQRRNEDIPKLIKLYNATTSVDEFIKEREAQEDPVDEDFKKDLYADEGYNLDRYKHYYLHKIKEVFFDNHFFRSRLIEDIISGKIKAIKEYSKLSYNEASEKYNKKIVFDDPTNIVKVYNDGYKWINVGPKCELIGNLMKNCGSTGVMSHDKDRTMMVLFDGNNSPHIVCTYSPNEKRISGIEGSASSNPKSEYDDYVLDLENVLDAKIDYNRVKTLLLGIKAMLKNHYKDIKILSEDKQWGKGMYLITMNNNKQYVTDSIDYFLPAEYVDLNDLPRTLYQFKNLITRTTFLEMYNIPLNITKY